MKSYTPQKLASASRYQNYFQTLPVDVQRDVYARMDELLIEERQWCDRGNYAHIG